MIDLTLCNEWQRRDETGLVMPYYTHPALAWLSAQNLKGKRVFEYGVGASTLWYRSRGATVQGAEISKEWAELIDCPVYEQKEIYVNAINRVPGLFDFIVVDGDPVEWRDDCVLAALPRLNAGGVLIFDNWMQPSLGWMPSEKTQIILLGMRYLIFSQSNHPDWKTLIAWNH